jgi:hypothetical protein
VEETIDSQKTAEYEAKEKQIMAEMGVKQRVDVPLDTEELLSYDPTKDLVVKLDNKKEIVMTQSMIVSCSQLNLCRKLSTITA